MKQGERSTMGDNQLHFNKRTQELLSKACKLGYRYLLLFELDLAYFMPLPLGINVLLLNDIEMLGERSHTLIISHEKEWTTSKNIHGKDTVSVKPINNDDIEYTSEISRLSIGVEVDKNDTDVIQNDREKEIILLQDVMHSLRNKIIEEKGLHIDADVKEYGMQRSYSIMYDDASHLYNTSGGCWTPSYNYRKEIKLPTGDILDTDKHTPAVLFAHKCEIAYHNHENYDCVLYAAIAIESYANELLRIKDGLYEQFYAGKYRSFSKLVEFLASEEVISKEKADLLISDFDKIRTMRNFIAHGKAVDVRINRQNATDAYESVKSTMTEYLMEYYQNQVPAFRIEKVQKY